MTTYLVLSTLLFVFLAVLWKADNLLNVSLKFIFVLLSGYGCVLALMRAGCVIAR